MKKQITTPQEKDTVETWAVEYSRLLQRLSSMNFISPSLRIEVEKIGILMIREQLSIQKQTLLKSLGENMKELNTEHQLKCPSYKAFGALGHNIHACDCGAYQEAITDLSLLIKSELEER